MHYIYLDICRFMPKSSFMHCYVRNVKFSIVWIYTYQTIQTSVCIFKPLPSIPAFTHFYNLTVYAYTWEYLLTGWGCDGSHKSHWRNYALSGDQRLLPHRHFISKYLHPALNTGERQVISLALMYICMCLSQNT